MNTCFRRIGDLFEFLPEREAPPASQLKSPGTDQPDKLDAAE